MASALASLVSGTPVVAVQALPRTNGERSAVSKPRPLYAGVFGRSLSAFPPTVRL